MIDAQFAYFEEQLKKQYFQLLCEFSIAILMSQFQLIVPIFDTKVTEYLCSGWVFFFFRQISTLN